MFRIMWFTTLGYAYYNASKWKDRWHVTTYGYDGFIDDIP